MLCKVSKTMCKTLQEHFKDYRFIYEEMSDRQYEMFVDLDILSHENDYDWEKKKFKVIRVSYPSTYYAMDSFLSTNDLMNCLNKTVGHTISQFINQVKDLIEI